MLSKFREKFKKIILKVKNKNIIFIVSIEINLEEKKNIANFVVIGKP
jgi:hypothetical protein